MPGRRGGGGRGRSRGRDGGRYGMPRIDESIAIRIQRQLEDFKASDSKELPFPADLSKEERKAVHRECERAGLTSKSRGSGRQRQVVIYKIQARRKLVHVDVNFSSRSIQIVQQYLARFPATPEEVHTFSLAEVNAVATETAHRPAASSSGSSKPAARSSELRGAAGFSAEEIRRRRERWLSAQQRPEVQELARSRSRLPIAAQRAEILAAVQRNQVVLIAGHTGCGKTTQVPQFILEDAWESERGCKVLCTQPRRISAVTISERIAAERGESLGENVGYTIRLESRGGPATSAVLCTTGVLLRMLTQQGDLDGITHVICDEAHERDALSDFLLVLLRELLPRRPALRLILMSATLHSELFSEYFNNCPIVSVPGFMHPVHEIYLDDILPLVNHQPGAGGPQRRGPKPGVGVLDAAIEQAFLGGSDADFEQLLEVLGVSDAVVEGYDAQRINHAHSQTGATGLMVAAGKGRADVVHVLLGAGADPLLTARNGESALAWAVKFGGDPEIVSALQSAAEAHGSAQQATEAALRLSEYQAAVNPEDVDLGLVAALLRYVCQGDAPGTAIGAVLVFLPGWDEISKLKNLLEGDSSLTPAACRIFPLHSMVPPAEQRAAFARMPPGTRKIVLATNIAETAVTIEDVVAVIDSGRVKEKSYDPYTSVSTFKATWISKASANQRRGRAGRCQEGVCFRLYSKQRCEAFQEYQLPELQRTPLDEICLQIKLLEGRGFGPAGLADFLARAPEPPPPQGVKAAVALLRDIGALEPESERLTRLGRHLAALPLPPRIGKMLLYGILFDCLAPVLTVACFMSYRDPWTLLYDSATASAVTAERKRLERLTGGCSDHLLLIEAYEQWTTAKAQGRDGLICRSLGLNGSTMRMVAGMRDQLQQHLKEQGFVPDAMAVSRHERQTGLVRAVLGATLYPLYGVVERKRNRHGPTNILTSSAEKVQVENGSVNCFLDAPRGSAVLVFGEKLRSEGRLKAQQTSVVPPHALLLAANRLESSAASDSSDEDFDSDDDGLGGAHSESAGALLVDGWLQARVPEAAAAPLATLRHRLAECFVAKVAGPGRPLQPAQQALLETLRVVFAVETEALGLAAQPAALIRPQPARAPFVRTPARHGSGRFANAGRYGQAGQGAPPPPPGFDGPGRAADGSGRRPSRGRGRSSQPHAW